MRVLGSSRAWSSVRAGPLPCCQAEEASIHSRPGPFFSWRTSQFTRVVGLPSRGAVTVTAQRTRPARKSAVILSRCDGGRHSQGAVNHPRSSKVVDSGLQMLGRITKLGWSEYRTDWHAQLT